MTIRLSIWRQFSSNHSSNFAIIGTFASGEAAQQAIATLEQLLDSISRFYADPANEAEWGHLWETWDWSAGTPPAATPVEREIGKRYGVEWPHAIDWFDQYELRTFLQDNIVLLATSGDVDMWAYPMNVIMERIGGNVATDNPEGTVNPTAAGVDLTCIAPTEEEAERIAKLVNEHVSRRLEVDIKLPWNLSFWAGEAHRNGAALEFKGLGFMSLRSELPQWLQYLRKQGYTDISYSFRNIEP